MLKGPNLKCIPSHHSPHLLHNTMRTLHFNTHTLCSSPPSLSSNYTFSRSLLRPLMRHNPTFSRTLKIRAISTIPESESAEAISTEVEPPAIDLAFVHSVLLPDGTPDVQIRTACGGQKLREIMLNSNLELYGPYARPLFNCGGGGTCGTCIVEVVQGKELLSPRTEKEKDILKKKPKTWRLACQTTVGKEDSRGQVVIQQLPEWKAHEWDHEQIKKEGLPPFC